MTTIETPTLWDSATVVPSRRPSIQERFETFHRANPWVMPRLLEMAHSMVDLGATRISVKRLWLELDDEIESRQARSFNNDFTALAARKLIEMDPSLDRVIELRRRKTP